VQALDLGGALVLWKLCWDVAARQVGSMRRSFTGARSWRVGVGASRCIRKGRGNVKKIKKNGWGRCVKVGLGRRLGIKQTLPTSAAHTKGLPLSPVRLCVCHGMIACCKDPQTG